MTVRKVLDARVAGTQLELPRHPRVEPLTLKSVLQMHPSKPDAVNADATPQEALKIMAENDVGAVLVVDGGRVIGLFSERDYARASHRTAQSLTATPVREMMASCDVIASSTDSVQDCLDLMARERLHYLPVQEGIDLVGMLSLDDLQHEMIAYLERVFKEYEVDQQIVFLRGTYSC